MKRALLIALVSIILGAGAAISTDVSAKTPRVTSTDSIDQKRLNESPVIDHESDPTVEERNLKREFRGTNLTPQQFEQIRAVRRQFRAELKAIMTNDIGKLVQLVLSPKAQAERQSVDIFRNPLTTYVTGLSRVLTPEQLKIWQRNVAATANNR